MLGIYTRLSLSDDNSNSIDNQLRQGKQFANKFKYPYKVFNEGEGLSGGLDETKRPQLNNLLEGVRSGKISAIWIRDQKRIERNTMLWLQIVSLLLEKDTDLYVNDVHQDMSDPTMRLQGTVLSALAEYQRNHQGMLTKKAIIENIKEGKIHGYIPYGYQRSEDNRMMINTKESEIVKRVYNMIIDGDSLNKISDKFNDEGVPTRTGIKWNAVAVRRLIKSKRYKGERVVKGVAYDCPLVIDEVLWEKANRTLSGNSRAKNPIVRRKYLLNGKLKCVRCKCHKNWYGIHKHDAPAYACSSRRNNRENKGCSSPQIWISRLDNFVWECLMNGDIKKHIEEFLRDDNTSGADNLKAELKLLEKQYNDNRKESSKLLDLVLKGLFEESEVVNKKSKLKQQSIELSSAIADLKLRLDNSKNNVSTKGLDKRKKYSIDERKDVIEKFIHSILILEKSTTEIYLSVVLQNRDITDLLYRVNRKFTSIELLPNRDENGAIILRRKDWRGYDVFEEDYLDGWEYD